MGWGRTLGSLAVIGLASRTGHLKGRRQDEEWRREQEREDEDRRMRREREERDARRAQTEAEIKQLLLDRSRLAAENPRLGLGGVQGALARRVAELEASGMSRSAANAQAREEFGFAPPRPRSPSSPQEPPGQRRARRDLPVYERIAGEDERALRAAEKAVPTKRPTEGESDIAERDYAADSTAFVRDSTRAAQNAAAARERAERSRAERDSVRRAAVGASPLAAASPRAPGEMSPAARQLDARWRRVFEAAKSQGAPREELQRIKSAWDADLQRARD